MNNQPTTERRSLWQAWERFWFAPADPVVLAAIRIGCGLITLYTIVVYSLVLQEFMGKDAWFDLRTRLDNVYNTPTVIGPLDGSDMPFPGQGRVAAPSTPAEEAYFKRYWEKWGDHPPLPYPANKEEERICDEYRQKYKIDVRRFNLPIPKTDEERKYAERYIEKWPLPPPPPYPKDIAADQSTAYSMTADDIDAYIGRFGDDPRRAIAHGKRAWSVWFHVTDPTWMAIIHAGFIIATLLFTLGLGTRVTAAITWFGALCYIHRNSAILFGVDTMMTILLLYLMVGPSGAALSLDRVVARWWSKTKPRVLAWWFAGRNVTPAPVESVPRRPEPSVGANFAIRLIQVHVCIIYFVAGISKLLGSAWWNGTAIWGTMANFEFAPIQHMPYQHALRFIGQHELSFQLFFTVGGYFTLFFEIGYCFLVWRPSLRWVILAMAITLHGFIGLFMGLKTFSFMMLVMNMAFLKPQEVHWVLGLFSSKPKEKAVVAVPQRDVPVATAVGVGAEGGGGVSTQIKRKK